MNPLEHLRQGGSKTWILAALLVAVLLATCTQIKDDVAAKMGMGRHRHDADESVPDGLKRLYGDHVRPLEKVSRYEHFYSTPINDAEFDAKPMVLVVGQYSVGKTTFIRSLLEKDFPGQRVGPEPTTDRFTVLLHGEVEQVVPGHALAMQTDKPFSSLKQLGNGFLTKFQGSVVNAPILRGIMLVDTPGVLSGEKQRHGRGYDFLAALSWFADRADLIMVMFDAHKLDVSDELNLAMDTLKPHHNKMRFVLNKADAMSSQEFTRVYGGLMWSLGKVLGTEEVPQIHAGSFWDKPLREVDHKSQLEKEKQDLLKELWRLPENAAMRKIDELVKRATSVRVHAYIIHYLRSQMPYILGKRKKQEKLIWGLDDVFDVCEKRYNIAKGDLPKVQEFQRWLTGVEDFSKFAKVDEMLVRKMDSMLTRDVPVLMNKAGGADLSNDDDQLHVREEGEGSLA